MGYEDKFIRAAQGPAFEAAVKQRFGFDSRGVDTLLRIAVKLSSPAGGTLSDRDVATFHDMHPQLTPHQVADWAVRINKAAPDRRAEMFVGTLAGDLEGMFGDHVDANDNFKQIGKMVEQYAREDLSQSVNAKLGGSSNTSPAWRPEPGSVRDLLERATVPKGHRDMLQAFDSGNPEAEYFMREALATKMQDGIDRLAEADLDMHSAVEAAYDVSVGADLAAEQFGVDTREDD
jgi:hypothetical protein